LLQNFKGLLIAYSATAQSVSALRMSHNSAINSTNG